MTTPSPRRRAAFFGLAAALFTAGCGAASVSVGDPALEPRDGRSGLQLSGTVDGRQVVVNDGAPRLQVGDCDPMDGVDQDVCAISKDIDGGLVVVVFENPDVLEGDVELPVADPGCRPQDCDHVGDVAIVDVQLGVGSRQRTHEGTLRVEAVEPFRRYAGTLRLVLPGGRLAGTFDLVPLPGGR